MSSIARFLLIISPDSSAEWSFLFRHQLVELILTQAHQRKVGRCVPRRIRRKTMGDQLTQSRQVLRGQTADRLVAMDVAAIGEAHAQPASRDLAVDVEQIVTLPGQAVAQPTRLLSGPERRPL